MKKSILTFVLLVAAAIMLQAQEPSKHLVFAGIPLDGPKEAFFESLAEKGFVRSQSLFLGGYTDEARGSFAGFSYCTVEVYAVPGEDVVYGVKLTIPDQDAPGFPERLDRFFSLLRRNYPNEKGSVEIDEDNDETTVTFLDAINTHLLEMKMYEDLGIDRRDYERDVVERAEEVKRELLNEFEEVDEEEIEEESIPLKIVEQKPSFRGGDASQFSKWVNERLVYPKIAKDNGVQGKVMIQFTVEPDGSVTNVRVLRGVDPSIDKEAVRVVSSSPKWTPGRQRGRAVRVTYTFPVIFQLN